MAAEPLCPAGWHKDIYRSARDAPCVVTTGWLSMAIGLVTVSNGLWFVAQAKIITMLRRHSERWRSFRMGTHVTLMLGALSWSCGAALLWCDMSGGLAAPRGVWRALIVLGCCMEYCVGLTMALLLLLDPAVRLVGGLDLSRSRQVQQWVKLMAWAWALGAHILTAGAGIALYGNSESVQAKGLAMLYGGVAATGAVLGIVFLCMGKLLQDVLSGLDSLSSSAKQVVALRKVLRIYGILAPSLAPLMILIMCVRPLKALTGVLVWYAVAVVSLVYSAAFPYYEHNRLRPVRSRSFRALKMTPRGSKIQPDSAAAIADRAIADHAAFISKGLIAVPERHTKARKEQDRPEGLARNGVSLAFMKRFADEFGVGTDATAAEVCTLHVKPITDTVKLSLVAVLQGERAGTCGATEPWVGAPTHFISYAWSYPFRTLIDIVEHHEEEFAPPMGTTNFYFLDQFSLNQHKFMATKQAATHAPHLQSSLTPLQSLRRSRLQSLGTPLQSLRRSLFPRALPALHNDGTPRTPRTSLFSRTPRTPRAPADPTHVTKEEMQNQTIETLRAQMLKSGHVLMCLWPLAAPAPLKRAWCLFELWTALQNGVKVTMCFGGADAAALYDAVRNGSFDIGKLVGEIRAQDAGCMEREDKDLILGLIEKEMGVGRFNAEMQEKLHKCLQDTVTAVIATH